MTATDRKNILRATAKQVVPFPLLALAYGAGAFYFLHQSAHHHQLATIGGAFLGGAVGFLVLTALVGRALYTSKKYVLETFGK